MQGQQLRNERVARGLSQKALAERLGVTQAYVSMLETQRRRLPARLARRLVKAYGLAPTGLPVVDDSDTPLDSDALASTLGALGYPGFQYLRDRGQPRNPATVLLHALRQQRLEPRLTAALPWVLRTYAPDLDWRWLVSHAKQYDLQNRLGFLVTLARKVAEARREDDKAQMLDRWMNVLEGSRLAKEDTLCRTLTNAERRFWEVRRPSEARHWNLLTGLTPEHLQR